MFMYFCSVKKWGKLQCFFTFHICCMLFIHPFLLLPLRRISNHLDISYIHKAMKFCISTSFTIQWKAFLSFFFLFCQCIIANFCHERKYFCPCKLSFCVMKPGTAHIPVKPLEYAQRLNLDFSVTDPIIKLICRMILPSLAKKTGQRGSRRTDWETGTSSEV